MAATVAPNEILTVEQVARMMQVTPRTIRNRINRGLLPARKMVNGKDWRIRRVDVDAMLQEPPARHAVPIDTSYRPRLIDRLGTADGRARARAVLAALGEDRDEAEQKASWAQLQQALEQRTMQFRRWNVESGERQDKAE